MYLGTRRVRSAGRTSGSIEITLPARLQSLKGLDCRLILRDGPRPEIVLQPDLSAAQALFQALWQRLRLSLGEIDEIGDFSLADFTVTLFPSGHWQERPPLAYADALAALHHDGPEGEAGVLSCLLAFMGVAAGQRLGLKGGLALAFGDAVAYLITGNSAGLGTDFERGMAQRVFWGEDQVRQPLGSLFADPLWQQAGPRFRRVFEQFRIWQDDPQLYVDARTKWYRAFRLEMGPQTFLTEAYLGQNIPPSADLESLGLPKRTGAHAS